MALQLIKQILDDKGNESLLSGKVVIDETTGKSFSEHIADKSVHLTAADVEAAVAPLRSTLNDFLTGEENGGQIDRLTELVKAIGENEAGIDALTTSVDEKLAGIHTFENAATLDAITTDANGDLEFNGKVLDGATSVACVASSEDTPVFDGKLILVVDAYTPPVAESE